MRFFTFLLLVLLFSANLNAGFFSDLFDSIGGEKSTDIIIQDDNEPDDEQFEDENGDLFSNSQNQPYSNNDNLDNKYIAQKKIFLQYKSYPKRVYVDQHFFIDIKAILTQQNLTTIATSFAGGERYKILNPNAPWQKIGDNIYENRYYFKLLDVTSKMPNIVVTTTNKHQESINELIKSKPLKLIALKSDEFFSNLIATKFDILSHHEKRYDDKQNIVLMEINASMSNLEDFHLSYTTREALDKFDERFDSQSIYYVSIIPNYIKEFKFKYFNPVDNKFKRVKFPIILADQTLSTQTGLNPQKSRYYTYKLVLLFSVAFVLFLIFLKYRSKFALLLSLLILIWTVYTKVLTQTITLKEGTNIRILPTENSTIFFKNPKQAKVQVLLKKRGYLKIVLPNQKIGWIKEDDIAKN